MKILLINPNSRIKDKESIVRKEKQILFPSEISSHLGLEYLQALIKEKKISCKIIDADLFDLNDSEILKIASEFCPTFIGVTLLHDNFHQGLSLIEKIKKELNVIIIVGGHLPTIAQEFLLNQVPSIDYAIIGEGEIALIKFIDLFHELKFKINQIPNFIYRDSGTIRKNHSVSFADLDKIPFPTRNDIDYIFLKQKKYNLPKALRVQLSRGCKGNCSFCSINTYYSNFKNLKWRLRSINLVVEEIKQLQTQYGVNLFYFSDDNFTESNHVKAFAQRIIDEKLDIQFTISSRIDQFSFSNFEILKNAGLMHVGVGLENISNDALYAFNKGYDNELIFPFMDGIKKLDISVSFFMILYHPFATIEEIYYNYLFLKKIGYFDAFEKQRNAFDILVASKMIVRRFTPIENTLVKNKLHKGYYKKNPFICRYEFMNKEVDIFWNDLYKQTINNEEKSEEIFLNLINPYFKKRIQI